MFTKQDVIKSVVLLWIVASVAYIGYDTWRDYQIRGIQQAYQSGATDTIKQLLDKSQATQCKETVPVSLGDTKVEFVDVKCLQQPASTAGGPAAGATPQAGAAATPKK